MATGTVKFFNEGKGFGFIIDDETQKESFVHVSNVVDKIQEGDKVTFDVVPSEKKPGNYDAMNVKLA